MKELILGGVRSGKSRLAELHANSSGMAVTYIATATAKDKEMSQRIKMHQAQRDPAWQLSEEPLALANALKTHAAEDQCIIVDCLTLWITNLLLFSNEKGSNEEDSNKKCNNENPLFNKERNLLIEVLPNLPGHIILVSNETGLGVVPLGEITRRYCDEAGWLHQQLAKICDKVTLTIAGLPTILKG